jgi:hypothetical protein
MKWFAVFFPYYITSDKKYYVNYGRYKKERGIKPAHEPLALFGRFSLPYRLFMAKFDTAISVNF